VGDQRGFRELSTWLFCHTIVQLPSSFNLKYDTYSMQICGTRLEYVG
jgi:hypothetical protein